MEYEMDNESKYTTLQVITMLDWKNMNEKKKKGHRHKSPQGGWGMGSKEPIQNYFINSSYNIRKLIWHLLILIQNETKSLQSAKSKDFSEKRESLGGIQKAQKSLSNSSSSSFLLYLIKNGNLIILKYSQNHSESTFGSAYI